MVALMLKVKGALKRAGEQGAGEQGAGEQLSIDN
jgi:hypothetical protein